MTQEAIPFYVCRDRIEEALSIGAEFRHGSALMWLPQQRLGSVPKSLIEDFRDYDARLSWVAEVLSATAPLPTKERGTPRRRDRKKIPLYVPRFRRQDALKASGVEWNSRLSCYLSDGTCRFAEIAEFLTPRMKHVADVEKIMSRIASNSQPSWFGIRAQRQNVKAGDPVYPDTDFSLPLDRRSGDIVQRVPKRALTESELLAYSAVTGICSYRTWMEAELSCILGFEVDMSRPVNFFEQLEHSASRGLRRDVPLYVSQESLDIAHSAEGVTWARRERRYIATPRVNMPDVRDFLTISAREAWRSERDRNVGDSMAIRAGAMKAMMKKPMPDRISERDILDER